MKKWMIILVATLLLMLCTSALADGIEAYVSISDAKGELVMAYEKVLVTDLDEDGALTINDALIAAHEQKHPDGKDAFISEKTEYGISMVKLWGEENGGSFGYYLNNASAWSLLDPIVSEDHVKTYAFTDLEMWSDTYAYFTQDAVTVKAGEAFEVKLCAAGYDANWNPVPLSVANAVMMIDGVAADAMTDAEGVAVITVMETGVYVLSAASTDMTLVPPVCIVTVE